MDETQRRKILDQARAHVCERDYETSSRDEVETFPREQVVEPRESPLWRSSAPMEAYRRDAEQRERDRKRADAELRRAEREDANRTTVDWQRYIDQRIADAIAPLHDLISEGAEACAELASTVEACMGKIKTKFDALEARDQKTANGAFEVTTSRLEVEIAKLRVEIAKLDIAVHKGAVVDLPSWREAVKSVN